MVAPRDGQATCWSSGKESPCNDCALCGMCARQRSRCMARRTCKVSRRCRMPCTLTTAEWQLQPHQVTHISANVVTTAACDIGTKDWMKTRRTGLGVSRAGSCDWTEAKQGSDRHFFSPHLGGTANHSSSSTSPSFYRQCHWYRGCYCTEPIIRVWGQRPVQQVLRWARVCH